MSIRIVHPAKWFWIQPWYFHLLSPTLANLEKYTPVTSLVSVTYANPQCFYRTKFLLVLFQLVRRSCSPEVSYLACVEHA